MRAAREAWFEGQLDLDPERLIFIDETAATTKMARLRGRAPKGERCRAAVPHGMCGRPGRCKKNLFDLYEACSGAAMCPASDAAVHMPRARMESGDQVQITGTRSIALTVSLVFLTPSYRRCAIPVL